MREGHTENSRARDVYSIREQNWSQFFSKAEIDLSRAMYFYAKAYEQSQFRKLLSLSYVLILLQKNLPLNLLFEKLIVSDKKT